jgi:hypothetical protein
MLFCILGESGPGSVLVAVKKKKCLYLVQAEICKDYSTSHMFSISPSTLWQKKHTSIILN